MNRSMQLKHIHFILLEIKSTDQISLKIILPHNLGFEQGRTSFEFHLKKLYLNQIDCVIVGN